MDNVRFITEDESLAKDMFENFGCILAHREIGAPTVKTKLIDIPFRNGTVDAYRTVSKESTYESRIIKLDFLYLGKTDHQSLSTMLFESFHGKTLWVEFSDDVGFWYKSQVTSIENMFFSDKAMKFTISCLCDPFKYDRNSTLVDWEWDALDLENGVINDVGELEIEPRTTGSFILVCRKNRAYPVINCNTGATVYARKIGDTIRTRQNIYPGKNILYELTFYEGENLIEIFNDNYSTNVKITIEYRGESL